MGIEAVDNSLFLLFTEKKFVCYIFILFIVYYLPIECAIEME